ncbi:N-acetyltransferase [Haladaptatus sp. T7]|uniref:GNAT family N-acetyltransferase n=1 Tax=Haladaptatus sp. T7 TaxID=2029368 RepID=UPI0021A25B67|nr:N-acetyltransferase [Haladaptatus sp. T7]GKZ12378.1 N-acetyltransferase [Haladaptatus sp. T7]
MHEFDVETAGPTDTTAIRDVVTAAFERDDEAILVDALRESPAYRPDLSFVARHDGDVIGHVMFTEVALSDRETAELVLAPLSVSPEHQRSGVGSRLVRVGLDAARDAGYELVFLHGDPDYYGRFGFTSAVDAGFENPFDMPDEAFQVYALSEDSLADVGGALTYPAPFRE